MAGWAVGFHLGVPSAAALIRWARVQHALVLLGDGACLVEEAGWHEIPVVCLPLLPRVGNVLRKLLVTLAKWAFTVAVVRALLVHRVCFKLNIKSCSARLRQSNLLHWMSSVPSLLFETLARYLVVTGSQLLYSSSMQVWHDLSDLHARSILSIGCPLYPIDSVPGFVQQWQPVNRV